MIRSIVVAAALITSAPVMANDMFAALTGVPYHLFRENLIRAGFKPAEATTGVCIAADRRCARFPEMRMCEDQPPSLCLASWKAPSGRLIKVATIGRVEPKFFMLSEED